MRRQHHRSRDNNLIWESLVNQNRSKANNIFKEDLEYVEDFIVREGLKDMVSGAMGSVKDFASEKLLQPIIKLVIQAIGKDPALAAKAKQAAEAGPQALNQLIQAQGDNTLSQQLEKYDHGQSIQSEAFSNQFDLNSLIVDALIESDIITADHGEFILEKRFDEACNIILEEHEAVQECPWQPRLVGEARGPKPRAKAGAAAGKISKIIQQHAKGRQGAIGKLVQQISKINPQFAKYVTNSSAQAPQQQAPQQQAPQQQAPQQQAPQQQAPQQQAPQQQAPLNVAPQQRQLKPGGTTGGPQPPRPGGAAPKPGGALSKVWNFIKRHKGKISGAVALGVLGVMLTTPAAPLVLPAFKAGLGGAALGGGLGFAKTKGGVMDRLKGAGEGAGKGFAMGSGAGLVGGALTDGIPDADPTVEPEVDPTVGPEVDPSGPVDGNQRPDGYSSNDVTDADIENGAVLDADIDNALAGDGSISDAEADRLNNDLNDDSLRDTSGTELADADGSPEDHNDPAAGTETDEPTTPPNPNPELTPGTPEYAENQERMEWAWQQMDADGNGVMTDAEAGPEFMKKYSELMGQWPGRS